MKKRIYVIYASSEWRSEGLLNVHHYSRCLSKSGADVIFVESIGLRKPSIARSSHDKKRVFSRLLRLLFHPLRREGNIRILTPLYYPGPLQGIFFSLLRSRLAGMTRGYERIDWVFLPSFAPALRKAGAIIYHAVDNYSANPGVIPEDVINVERHMCAKADLIFCTCSKIKDLLIKRYGATDITVLANDVVDSAGRDKCDLNDEILHPSLVYVGNIAKYKIDTDLIVELSRNNPGTHFYFAGPRGKGEEDAQMKGLEPAENIHFLPSVPHGQLTGFLRKFNAGFLPYLLNESTAYSFPMKYMEYIKAGLPVWSTALPCLSKMPFIFYIGSEPIKIKEPDNGLKRDMEEYCSNRSWTSRIDDLVSIIDSRIEKRYSE